MEDVGFDVSLKAVERALDGEMRREQMQVRAVEGRLYEEELVGSQQRKGKSWRGENETYLLHETHHHPFYIVNIPPRRRIAREGDGCRSQEGVKAERWWTARGEGRTVRSDEEAVISRAKSVHELRRLRKPR